MADNVKTIGTIVLGDEEYAIRDDTMAGVNTRVSNLERMNGAAFVQSPVDVVAYPFCRVNFSASAAAGLSNESKMVVEGTTAKFENVPLSLDETTIRWMTRYMSGGVWRAWQTTSPGGSNGSETTYDFSFLAQRNYDGRMYKCTMNTAGSNGVSIESAPAVLHVPQHRITVQPQLNESYVANSDRMECTVESTLTDIWSDCPYDNSTVGELTTISYQWYADKTNTPDGTWDALSSGSAGLSGVTTPTLKKTPVPNGWNGWKFKCRIEYTLPGDTEPRVLESDPVTLVVVQSA